MSKLRTRIRDIVRRRPAALGFALGAQDLTQRRELVVVAEVSSADDARQAAAAKVDALLFRGLPADIGPIVEAAGTLPVGCHVEAATPADTAALAEASADFLLFDDASTEAQALLDERLGHVLELADVSAAEEDLRLVAPLGLDALLLPDNVAVHSVRDQLRVRRVGELTRKPLAIRLTVTPTPETLHVWRDAGVRVVILPASDLKLVRAVVEAAGAVPPPRDHDDERPSPLVPSPGPAHDHDEDD